MLVELDMVRRQQQQNQQHARRVSYAQTPGRPVPATTYTPTVTSLIPPVRRETPVATTVVNPYSRTNKRPAEDRRREELLDVVVGRRRDRQFGCSLQVADSRLDDINTAPNDVDDDDDDEDLLNFVAFRKKQT